MFFAENTLAATIPLTAGEEDVLPESIVIMICSVLVASTMSNDERLDGHVSLARGAPEPVRMHNHLAPHDCLLSAA